MNEPDSRTSARTATEPSGGGSAGKVVVVVTLTLGGLLLALLGVLAYLVQDIQDDIDDANGPDQTSVGGYGEPVSPGDTVRYTDDVHVTLSEPRRAGGRTFAFSLTYRNDGDEPLALDPDYARAFDFWAGPYSAEDQPSSDNPSSESPRWRNGEQVEAMLPRSVPPGDSLTLPLRYTLAADVPLTTFGAEFPDGREAAYWEVRPEDLRSR